MKHPRALRRWLFVTALVCGCGSSPEPGTPEQPQATPRPAVPATSPEPARAPSPEFTRHLREARGALEAPPSDDDRYLRAGDALEAALRLEPGQSEAWFLLGQACEGELGLEKPRTTAEAQRLEGRLWDAYCNALRQGCGSAQVVLALESLRARIGAARPAAEGYAQVGAALESRGEVSRAWDFYAAGAREVGNKSAALLEAERRCRSEAARELEDQAQRAPDPEAEMRLVSQAHYLASERQAAEELRARYYALAAQRLVTAAGAGLPAGSKVGVRYVVNAQGAQTQAGELLRSSVVKRLAAAGFKVVPAPELERRAAELALDLGLATQPQALAGLGVDALLWAAIGQRAELYLTRVPEGTLVASESLDLLLDRELSAPPAPRLDPVQLEVKALAERRLPGGRVEELWVSEGALLREDDLFQVHVRVGSHAYLYVILGEESGQPGKPAQPGGGAREFTRLYPHTHRIDPAVPSGFSRNPIPPERLLRIPPDPRGFILDGREGRGTLFVIASRRRLVELEELLDRLSETAQAEAAGVELGRRLDELAARPLAGRTRSAAPAELETGGGRTRTERLDLVEGWGVALRAIRFEHRARIGSGEGR